MSNEMTGRWRHYKGKMYQVLGVARHTETMEELVVYQALYPTEFGPDAWWVRPRAMFESEVEVNGQKQPRFVKIESEE